MRDLVCVCFNGTTQPSVQREVRILSFCFFMLGWVCNAQNVCQTLKQTHH